MVDLLMTAEQRQIVDSVSDFLKETLPVERLRPNATTRQEDTTLREMAGLGWYMIGLEERHGGLGMTVTEEALIFREFGRYLLGPSTLATVLAMRVAAAAGHAELCQKMADGSVRVALANPTSAPQLGPTVSGEFQVFDGSCAEILLMISEDGAAAIVSRASVNHLEQRRSAVDGMTLEYARCADAQAVACVPAGSDLFVRLSLLCAAMLSGICEATRDLATEYAKMRVQFGRPIGSFQAIKHKCSDMALRADAACNLVNFSAVTLAAGQSDGPHLCTASKLLSARYALISAKEAIQVHGGIGYTVECNAHHFLKRAHLYDLIGGSSFRQQQLILADATQLPELAA